MAMPREKEFDGYVLDGMARALWSHAYMIWATEVEPAPQMGETWDEMTPDNPSIRRASRQAADALADLVGQANNLGKHPMATLFAKVSTGWDANVAYAFGEEVAHLCMGTRDLDDSTLILPRRPGAWSPVLPHFKVELDDDGQDLTWDGGMSYPGRDSGQGQLNPPPGCRHNPDAMEILVVEDDKTIQRMYPRLLRKLYPEAEIYIVDNYEAAIGYLKTHDIKLVISDVNIIGAKTGIDVFEWVKAQQPHLVDQYLFITGGNPQVARMHHRYLEKPASLDAIRGALSARSPQRAPAPPPPAARSISTAEVAAAVKSLLPTIKRKDNAEGRAYDRFGQKVFISALWRRLEHDPAFRGMTLPQFKARLIEANRNRMLELVRADLVAAMDHSEVVTSEIKDMGATFHFVLDPDGPGW